MEIKEVHKYSIYNMDQAEASKKAGCYHCLAEFEPSAIKSLTDDDRTALCPKCGIDSVLFDASLYEINQTTLIKLKKYWFNNEES